MSTRVAPPAPACRARNRVRWSSLACLFAFVVVVHLSLMAASLSCGTSVPPAAMHCGETCPTSLARACTVVEQAVEPVPLIPFVLVALLALGMIAQYRRAVVTGKPIILARSILGRIVTELVTAKQPALV